MGIAHGISFTGARRRFGDMFMDVFSIRRVCRCYGLGGFHVRGVVFPQKKSATRWPRAVDRRGAGPPAVGADHRVCYRTGPRGGGGRTHGLPPQSASREPRNLIPTSRLAVQEDGWRTRGLPPFEAVLGLMLARSDPSQATLEGGIWSSGTPASNQRRDRAQTPPSCPGRSEPRAARSDAFTRDPSAAGARRFRLAAELSLG